jgi:hypothetical protein
MQACHINKFLIGPRHLFIHLYFTPSGLLIFHRKLIFMDSLHLSSPPLKVLLMHEFSCAMDHVHHCYWKFKQTHPLITKSGLLIQAPSITLPGVQFPSNHWSFDLLPLNLRCIYMNVLLHLS